MVFSFSPETVPAMNDRDPFRNSGQLDRVTYSAVSAAYNHNMLSLIQHSVTGSAVADSPSGPDLLSRKAQLPGSRARGVYHGPAVYHSAAGHDFFWIRAQIQGNHFPKFCFRSKPLRIPAHSVTQGKAIYAFAKSWIILYMKGQGHLSSRKPFFQHQDIQPRPGRVKGRRIAPGTSADDYHIINVFHCNSP